MRILQSSIFRAICAIAVGVLLVNNPDSTVKWITIAIGAMFFLSGIISLAAWLSSRSRNSEVDVYDANGQLIVQSRPTFPIVGLGSGLLGLMLMLLPSLFVASLMYVLGAIVLLGAISQFVTLIKLNRTIHVSWMMWVCPSLLLLVAVYVLVKPVESAAVPLLIFGWCLMVYGAMECINAIAVYKRDKVLKAQQMQTTETETSEQESTHDE